MERYKYPHSPIALWPDTHVCQAIISLAVKPEHARAIGSGLDKHHNAEVSNNSYMHINININIYEIH